MAPQHQIRLIPPYNRKAPTWSVATFSRDPVLAVWKEARRKRFANQSDAASFARELSERLEAELIEVKPVR